MEEKQEQFDVVKRPSHYVKNGVECKQLTKIIIGDVLCPMTAYWLGCAIKYIFRWQGKNGVEDLRKAQRCIEEAIAEAEENGY